MPDKVEHTFSIIAFVKASGPYIVALVTSAFAYLQSRKSIKMQKDIAKTNAEKDIAIAKMGHQQEFLYTKKQTIAKLEELHSPVYAKLTWIFHHYIGQVSGNSTNNELQKYFNEIGLIDTYIEINSMTRKLVLAKSIALCQLLDDQKSYELCIKLDRNLSLVLSKIDISGQKRDDDSIEELKQILSEYNLNYVALFYSFSKSQSSDFK